jgi:ABC transporter DrrB family efflux protein
VSAPADSRAAPPTTGSEPVGNPAPSGRLVADTLAITGRNLIRVRRTPQLLVFSTIQPVIFLLVFVYVFGGAIGAGGDLGVDYVDFVVPGILVQTATFGATQTAVGLASDLQAGLVDRLRSLPIARSSVLAGRTLADATRTLFVLVLTLSVGHLLGFRFSAGVLPALGVVALVVVYGFTFSWVFACVGLLTRDPETAQAASFPAIFPLVFVSGVFVPIETLPSWLQGFAGVQPVTATAEALRALALGGPTTGPVLAALAWMAAILAVFVPFAVHQYRKG